MTQDLDPPRRPVPLLAQRRSDVGNQVPRGVVIMVGHGLDPGGNARGDPGQIRVGYPTPAATEGVLRKTSHAGPA